MTRLPYIVDSSRPPYFPAGLEPDEHGLVAAGGDLSEAVLREAYSKGIFPWFVGPPVMWFSPDPRAVLFPGELLVSRRLARTLRRRVFSAGFDTDFERVIDCCAAVPRPGQDGTWICGAIRAAYTRLYGRGLAHCVAVYREGELCGGLYGLSLGRVFFGESMFSLTADASKVALVYLVERLKQRDFHFIDCQVPSAHLESLGVRTLPRSRFLKLLKEGLAFPDDCGAWR
jgi:leucyl/phenylalanyl-tRNA--protein transferase